MSNHVQGRSQLTELNLTPHLLGHSRSLGARGASKATELCHMVHLWGIRSLQQGRFDTFKNKTEPPSQKKKKNQQKETEQKPSFI